MTTDKKKVHIKTKDFLVSKESFSLVKNEEIGVLVTTPQPPIENLASYYESDSYISHTDDNKEILSSVYQLVKKKSLKDKLKLIKKLNGGFGSLLDIGAGTGEFLITAKKNGWNVSGIEPNEKARMIANDKGVLLKENLKDFEGEEYDVVTLWHVLEHLPNLEDAIKTISSYCKPGGILIIAVPNYKSWDATYYKEFWAAYDVPRHLWHFSQDAMYCLFNSQMNLLKIKPLYFDSFYVSLLSEKYKTGNAFSIKAFFIGLWSNLKAARSSEYSSLIYCYKKENKAK